MKLKSLNIGRLTTNNNIVLAPMAGYTDYAFRHLAIKQGYGLTFTELVSAKGIMYGGKGSEDLLYTGEDTARTVAQLFGSDEYYMQSACESQALSQFSVVDINMGCPVPKVFKNGEGSALLTDIQKAERIIKACVKSGKTITVKIRTGIKQGDDIARDYAVMAEQSGASLITIHGRVRDAYYSGEPNYDAIASAKNAVKIPVIANGGIFTVEDADKMLNNTGADGIMLARGGIADPFLVCKLLGETPSVTLKTFMKEQLCLMAKNYGEDRAYREFRKFVPYYFKGVPNSKETRISLQTASSVEEIYQIIDGIL